MKKFIHSVALALGVGLALTASSVRAQNVIETENYKLTTYVQEDLSRVWINVHKNLGTKFILFVRNERGEVLFHYGLGKKKEDYAYKINLKDVEAGVYYIDVTDGTNPIRKTIRKERIAMVEPTVTQKVVAMN